ncbi:MAG: RNA polymerase sigma factor [Desulfosalsimonadaceae bacterium]
MKKPTAQAEIFEALLTPHIPALYKTAYRLTGSNDKAEDLVQELLVKLYPKTDEIQTVQALGPWLKKALYRQFVDELRKTARRPEGRLAGFQDEIETVKAPSDNPEKMAEIAQIRENLQDALNILDQRHRSVVLMHLAEGYTLKEIATIHNAPAETIKTQFRRAKTRLKKYLKM